MPEFVGRLRPPRLDAAPASPAKGEMYFDTITNALYHWDGGAWVAGGGGAAEVHIGPSAPTGEETVWIDTDEPDPNPYAIEALHLIGEAGEPPFATGYSNYAPGSYPMAGFYKDPLGRVHLTGLIKKSSAVVAYETIFTLPAGYRPSWTSLFTSITSIGAARLDVNGVGTVTIGTAGTQGHISLDGISFRAFQ